jgi:hypothetical protein
MPSLLNLLILKFWKQEGHLKPDAIIRPSRRRFGNVANART